MLPSSLKASKGGFARFIRLNTAVMMPPSSTDANANAPQDRANEEKLSRLLQKAMKQRRIPDRISMTVPVAQRSAATE
jgi:hypothetical protein